MRLPTRYFQTLVACFALAGYGCGGSSSGSTSTVAGTPTMSGGSATESGMGGTMSPSNPSAGTPATDGPEVPDEQAGSPSESGGAIAGGQAANLGGDASSGGQPAGAGQSDSGGQANAAGQAELGGQSSTAGQVDVGGQATMGGQAEIGGQADMGGQANMDDMVTPEFEPSENCVIDPNDACAENFQACVNLPAVDGPLCAYDMRPDVFRLSAVTVSEPEASAPLLTGALSQALESFALNLLVEPGGYFDTGYRWYVGNARRYTATGTYDYFKTADGVNLYPVQNFDGVWRSADGVDPHWTLENNTGFVLNIPTDETATVDGNEVSCFTTFTVNVTLSMTPRYEEGTMTPYIDVAIAGILRQADIMGVSIPTAVGEITLLQALSAGDPSIDTDDDGVADAYPFVLSGKAEKIVTAEDFDFPGAVPGNRSPEARDNPEECE